ncbi:MAG: HAMP domain-containing sensor histidine kinase [Pirellulales bacterium]
MKSLRSIRVRLLVLIGLLLFVALAGFGYVAWRRETAARFAAIDRALEERLNLLITGFRPNPGQRLESVTEPRLSPRARELFANDGGEPFYYGVWLSDGQVQARSDAAPDMYVPARTETQFVRTRENFRELIHFTPTGRCFLVGRSMHYVHAEARADAFALAAIGTGILTAGLGLAWWIASRVTRPLLEISRTAEQIAAGELSQRINLANTEDELSDVAKVLNDTFARLETAFERQKQFTADASHELRTPVSLIMAHAQGALLHDQSPEEYREALADCVQAAQRMKTLIDSRLELARFDAETELVQREACDLALLVRDCASQLRSFIDAKRLRIELELQPAPCQVDPSRITQVILNLLNNAIQHTPYDGKIVLRTFKNEGVCFSISDEGPGISADDLPHLFERFRRTDASRNRATGGNGLGLAICKAIVEAHGGKIKVESQAAKGCTFTVELQPSDK